MDVNVEHGDAAIIAALEDDDNEMDEMEEVAMRFAEIAVAMIMEMEDGVGLADDVSWEKITVDIDEYHRFSDRCFRLHFRMPKHIFEALEIAVGNHLVNMNRWRRNRTPLRDILLMVLWILATPDTFRSVALRFGVRPSTLHYHYTYIVEALREMAPVYIKWPNREERQEIAGVFHRRTGFPGVIACIDCTHVFVTAPVEQPARYRNRHHSYSMNVQAMCDNNLLVRNLHVGEVGSMHDSRVFRRSPIFSQLLEDDENTFLNGDEHIVGDGAYTLTDKVLVPFPRIHQLTPDQRRFNRKLSQCRIRIENAFGRAKGKWRRLKFLHALNPAYVVDHVTACFVLHNFIITNGEPLIDEDELGEEVGEDEDIDDPDAERDAEEDQPGGNEHPNLAAAKRRGIEKRQFIMNHILRE